MKNRYESLESKLTPAARDALTELMKDLRNQLLEAAARSALSPSGDIREITVKDIFSSYETIRTKPRIVESETVKVLYMSGITVGVALAAFGAYYMINDSLGGIGLALYVVGGLIASFLAVLYMRYRRAVRSERQSWKKTSLDEVDDYSMLIVRYWQGLELQIKSFVASEFGESRADSSITRLVPMLEEKDIISQSEKEDLSHILLIRNRIVHEGMKISKEEALESIKKIENISAKLEKKLA